MFVLSGDRLLRTLDLLWPAGDGMPVGGISGIAESGSPLSGRDIAIACRLGIPFDRDGPAADNACIHASHIRPRGDPGTS